MAKNLNVRSDENVHARKNPHYVTGQEYVEASHLDVLITLDFGAVLLAAAAARAVKSGADLPQTADEVWNALKRQCRTLIFESVRTTKQGLSAKELAAAQAALCSLGFSKPKATTPATTPATTT